MSTEKTPKGVKKLTNVKSQMILDQPKESTNGSINEKTKKAAKENDNNEFFDYLAYHGVKNQKAAELDKLKKAEELAGCTFKPAFMTKQSVSSLTPKKIFDNLSNQRKDLSSYENKKKQLEMRNCTFKPTIDKKSDKLAQNSRGLTSNKSYDVLHKKHNDKLVRVRQLIEEKKNKEIKECTFTPVLQTKLYKKRPQPENAPDTERKSI